MTLITWSASRCERPWPAQRKRPGEFCTMTARSKEGNRLRLVTWAIFARCCKRLFASQFYCDQALWKRGSGKKPQYFEFYWYYNSPHTPILWVSCMDTVGVCENKAFIFKACSGCHTLLRKHCKSSRKAQYNWARTRTCFLIKILRILIIWEN